MSELGDAFRKLRKKAKVTPEEEERGYKRVTQDVLAARMGWANASHVSEIETGQRIPEVDTLVRWVTACNGTEGDENYLRGVAGYLPITHLPRSSHFLPILTQISRKTLMSHPYPCYIVDYRSLVWSFNSVCGIYFENQQALFDLVRREVNLFHMMFDPCLPIRNKIVGLEPFQRRQITLFKLMNYLRQHEPFYRTFDDDIGRALPPEYALEFKRMWNETHVRLEECDALHREQMVIRYRRGFEVVYNIFAEKIYNFRDLFALIRLEPDREMTSPSSLAELEAICEPLRGLPSANLWDVIDTTSFLQRYNGT